MAEVEVPLGLGLGVEFGLELSWTVLGLKFFGLDSRLGLELGMKLNSVRLDWAGVSVGLGLV